MAGFSELPYRRVLSDIPGKVTIYVITFALFASDGCDLVRTDRCFGHLKVRILLDEGTASQSYLNRRTGPPFPPYEKNCPISGQRPRSSDPIFDRAADLPRLKGLNVLDRLDDIHLPADFRGEQLDGRR